MFKHLAAVLIAMRLLVFPLTAQAADSQHCGDGSDEPAATPGCDRAPGPGMGALLVALLMPFFLVIQRRR